MHASKSSRAPRTSRWCSRFAALLYCAALAFGANVARSAATAANALQSQTETLTQAKAALAEKNPQKAVELIEAFLARAVGNAELEETFGKALLALGRKDEAAHHFGKALVLVGDNEAPQKSLRASLQNADPLYTSRAGLMRDVVKNLLADGQKLYDAGHTDRALALLVPLEPIAGGAEKQAIVALTTKIRASQQEVQLDSGGEGEANGAARALVKHEGAHYHYEANLEPEIVRRVSDVMDDIFNYYVLIYFDGELARVASHKPTIRIFGTRDEMLATWQGQNKPEGWWSPGDWQVVCYDTRTNSASLDNMLTTLYHEASHHFMTMLSKGGGTPAWINEGTATFFEGATAMADRRVLWPDAASGRLAALHYQLTRGMGPKVEQVIAFNEGGSYGPEYYSYGWGLVYFLQQYEDPTTLEYVFRPLYSKYRETISTKGGDPTALFREIFLQPTAPGGFTKLDDWVAMWRDWILNQVHPLHTEGPRRRELRMDKAKAYVQAADRAKGEKQPKVPELELLTRALGQLEFIRKKIDGDEHIDPDLIVMQADVLERLGRPQGTAALLDQVLELADKGDAELEEERYDELAKRLSKLDTKNQALRQAKVHAKNFAKRAQKLLDDYEAAKLPLPLTSYEVASLLADALDNPQLKERALELRVKAREAGLLRGALYKVGGKGSGSWVTIFDASEDNFEVDETKLTISGTRPVGRIFTGVPLSGEYELRCQLGRAGEITRTSLHGVVFAGTPNSEWFVAGIDGKGQLVLRRHDKNASERGLKVVKLEPMVAKDESPAFVVRVLPGNVVNIRVGERAPVEITLEDPLPRIAYIGVFAKNARTELTSTVLEVFP